MKGTEKMRCRAFTLAETLVTLAIIGVIAMIIFPTLKSLHPNKEMVMFKKAYFLTSRAVNELINDEDFYPECNSNANNAVGFGNTDLNANCGTTQATVRGIQYSGNPKFCGLFASKLDIRGSENDLNNLCQQRISLDNGGNFTTTDGMTWSMPVSNFSNNNNSEYIYIDIDGPNKGKNCAMGTDFPGAHCTDNNSAKPDRFAIRVYRDGTLRVENNISREYLSENDTTKQYYDIRNRIADRTNAR